MKPQILSVIQPAINWIEFLKAAKATLGHDISKIETERNLSDPAKFLSMMGKFLDSEATDGLANLRNANTALGHLRYGFMIAADQDVFMELLQFARLKFSIIGVDRRDYLGIVSGDLDAWRDCIIEISEFHQTDTRLLADHIYASFDRLGLSELWHAYRKKPLPDNTFLLEKK